MEILFIFILLLLLLSLNYLSTILYDKLLHPSIRVKEGFENITEEGSTIAGAIHESKDIIQWLDNSTLYDTFFAEVYDELTQGSVRTQAEVGLLLHEWTKRGDDLTKFEVLDAGCGTGIAVASMAKMNVKKVVGIDSSPAMLKQAKLKTIPQTTLTEEQKEKIDWRQADLIDPSAAAGGEFSHVALLYFTIYYFNDKEALFRNLYFWTKPGGRLAVEVVNKHKFDPMLESATPWLGFSLQKYADSRITKSEVDFNKFKYIGEFDLQDPQAEFRETFRFKDGKVRRQRHTLKMEDMNQIVGMAKAAGWEYLGYTDLTMLHLEYFYILHFKHQ
jgi:SAM-dependent methyltransferase